MRSDNLEFSICQYLDGALSAPQRAALETRLKDDPSAQAMLAEHRNLDAALRAMPLPSVQWDAFAQSISAAVDAADEERPHSYRMPAWVRVVLPLALAASVMILAWVGVRSYWAKPIAPGSVAVNQDPKTAVKPHDDTFAMVVIGPQADPAANSSEIQISVGPSAAVEDEPIVVQYSDDVVSRPSSVTIASGMVPAREEAVNKVLDME